MPKCLLKFLSDESGSAVIDWLVIAAATAGLGITIITSANTGVELMAISLQAEMSKTTYVIPE